MSSIISISVKDRVAQLTAPAVIVRGNSGYKVQFAFDDDWSEYSTKTAVFNYRRNGMNLCQKVDFTGDQCSIPAMYWDTSMVNIGVTAGDEIASTSVCVYCEESVSDGDANEVEIGEDGNLVAKSGASAYELAVENGYTGTVQEWLLSLKGAAGKTPVRGVDYWTTSDKQDIVNQVLAELNKQV